MKVVYFGFLVFFVGQPSNAAVVRKQPAFSKPIYADSYLPAAMQVIFHAVGQLKNMESEEIKEANSSTMTVTMASIPSTSPHAPGQHQPEPQYTTSSLTTSEVSTESIEVSSALPLMAAINNSMVPVEVQPTFTNQTTFTGDVLTIITEASTTSAASAIASIETSIASATPLYIIVDDLELSVLSYENANKTAETKPQVIETITAVIEAETREGIYAMPEANHEIQETVHEIAESNNEIADRNGTSVTPTTVVNVNVVNASATTVSEEEGRNESTVSEEAKEDSTESKSSSSEETKEEMLDSAEEEDDEIRFTLIGEKVAQVPRPSLTSYLRKTAKSALTSSTEKLASLYDALSKDARKQGLAKFSGYSDEVLATLNISAEGGLVPQLRILLEKTAERKELTRDDAKFKLASVLKQLNNPATNLTRDLRLLNPLRYVL